MAPIRTLAPGAPDDSPSELAFRYVIGDRCLELAGGTLGATFKRSVHVRRAMA